MAENGAIKILLSCRIQRFLSSLKFVLLGLCKINRLFAAFFVFYKQQYKYVVKIKNLFRDLLIFLLRKYMPKSTSLKSSASGARSAQGEDMIDKQRQKMCTRYKKKHILAKKRKQHLEMTPLSLGGDKKCFVPPIEYPQGDRKQ